ncbi:3-isopropylmalate dehydratase large subunit [Desulfolutivibrio sulfoxidireducens]|uniref:3-isopropylmalate dehydratase large subunit n=1 Tax=Desulfolutivibrio sulfoxidireducens TaxID=2773299 RepID=UPI00159E29A4|nr:3-isopropylmalate dehydratase large subunit [Desulfolutivibrio sulfoxidireducens]QLA16670.1 3-isopropylmalate dehydratase large subunit [Desulfolutivibrio sulfoxidireducens]QLA19453.1 3-isopropylmalate dehydratase large subunit [Desulfolutivibrio sulfoxidireducens]
MRRTLAEKILAEKSGQEDVAPGRIVRCPLSLVLANDITAPLAIKAMAKMGADAVFDREKVVIVCDHFTPNKDIDSAEQVKFCREFARKMGLVNYFEGGNVGVEHALLPELGLVGPGDVVVGGDSHTCTYGGLGAFATGLGSTDIGAAMALGETWFKVPPTIKVVLAGKLAPFVGAKDLMLRLIGMIGVSGALYKALEFTGPLATSLSVEGRMTMANMAIEAGAKVGLFAADDITAVYAAAHGRMDAPLLSADPGATYEREVVIDATSLSPQVACPHLPDNVKPVEELSSITIDQAVIGSCTNGRIEDLRVAAAILKGKKAAKNVRLIILPATPAIWKEALHEGLLEIFMDAGAIIGPPTCGPCLGGHMGILAGGERAIATTNRNFKGRMGSLDSEVYLASPAVAAASALTGVITHPGRV